MWSARRRGDLSGLPGQEAWPGAYVCPNMECLKRVRKAKALERAFSTQIPADVFDALEAQMEQGDG